MVRMSTVFSIDPVFEHFFPSHSQNYRNLCAAVVQRAIDDLKEPVTLYPWRNRFLIRSAIEFFLSDADQDTESITFSHACNVLDLKPHQITDAINLEKLITDLWPRITKRPDGVRPYSDDKPRKSWERFPRW